jgi:hypothetical protein
LDSAGTYLPTELAYRGGLYVLTHNGILTRFDASTGVQTYKARIGEGGDFTSSPWGYNDKSFCLNEEGRTFVIRAGDKYELLDSNDLGEMALATPALIDDSPDPAHRESPLLHPQHTQQQAPLKNEFRERFGQNRFSFHTPSGPQCAESTPEHTNRRVLAP